MTIAAIALGGAIGSVLRYLLASATQQWMGRSFPLGTLSVNVLGCLVIGVLYVWLVERSPMSAAWLGFWMTGLLGGFTTFSAFSLETVNLFAQGAWIRALAYIGLSVAVCLAATAGGIWAARQFGT